MAPFVLHASAAQRGKGCATARLGFAALPAVEHLPQLVSRMSFLLGPAAMRPATDRLRASPRLIRQFSRRQENKNRRCSTRSGILPGIAGNYAIPLRVEKLE